MFFFNGRIRNTHVVPMITDQRMYTNKLNYCSIITTCLTIVIGLAFVVIGLISETEKTTFFCIGIFSMCFGFFTTTLICFYTKLYICYHNWAYGQHITPNHAENSHAATAGDITISYCTGPTSILPPRVTINSIASNKTGKTPSNIGMKKSMIRPSIDIV